MWFSRAAFHGTINFVAGLGCCDARVTTLSGDCATVDVMNVSGDPDHTNAVILCNSIMLHRWRERVFTRFYIGCWSDGINLNRSYGFADGQPVRTYRISRTLFVNSEESCLDNCAICNIFCLWLCFHVYQFSCRNYHSVDLLSVLTPYE